jgi:hypothetical protein
MSHIREKNLRVKFQEERCQEKSNHEMPGGNTTISHGMKFKQEKGSLGQLLAPCSHPQCT